MGLFPSSEISRVYDIILLVIIFCITAIIPLSLLLVSVYTILTMGAFCDSVVLVGSFYSLILELKLIMLLRA